MSKQAERDYLKKLTKAGVFHTINKPFSDIDCGSFLAEIGAIMSLLPNPPVRILDLGCGIGWTSRLLVKRGYEVVGMDISEDMIKLAKEKAKGMKNLKFLVGDFEEMKFKKKFDAVIFYGALHHSSDEKLAITKAYNSLKKEGVCIISEPGKGHSKAETSIKAMKEFGVTEKDILPRKIIKLGKLIGFKRFQVCPHGFEINDVTYTPLGESKKKGLFERIFKFNIIGVLPVFYLITYRKYQNGIVTMKK